MRIAAMVLACVGALAALGSGLFLVFAFSSSQDVQDDLTLLRSPDVPEVIKVPVRAIHARLMALPYFILAGAGLSVIAGLIALDRRGVSAGVLLLTAVAGPVALIVGIYTAVPTVGDRQMDAVMAVVTGLLLVFVAAPAILWLLAAVFAFLTRPQPALSDGAAPPPLQDDEERPLRRPRPLRDEDQD